MAGDRWRPLSVRQKGNTDEWDAPVEGVPPWLRKSLMAWVYKYLLYDQDARGPDERHLRAVEVNLRVPLDWSLTEHRAYESLLKKCEVDSEYFLDLIDYTLHVVGGDRRSVELLETLLVAAGSAWAVAPDNEALTRRTPPEAAEAAKDIVTSGSRAGPLVAAAWKHVYGRHPNPGTGYREAVRAIEAVACPVVIPDDPAPSLGKAIAALRNGPKGKYATVFPETTLDGKPQEPLEAVRSLMQLVWKSELDRHTPADENIPLSVTQEQAEAALHAGVTLVQWFQRGFVSRAP
jgi:hypothetical protein